MINIKAKLETCRVEKIKELAKIEESQLRVMAKIGHLQPII